MAGAGAKVGVTNSGKTAGQCPNVASKEGQPVRWECALGLKQSSVVSLAFATHQVKKKEKEKEKKKEKREMKKQKKEKGKM